VSDHSFRVAVIAVELLARIWNRMNRFDIAQSDGDTPRSEWELALMWTAINHDVAESHTGDISGGVKYRYPAFKSALGAVERTECEYTGPASGKVATIVKIADLVESTTWLQHNKHGSHADTVHRWLRQRRWEAVQASAPHLGIDADELAGVVQALAHDIEIEEGRNP
jgi:5'-deoxynucleotidase YfbR-like HD superfamily hydrolase